MASLESLQTRAYAAQSMTGRVVDDKSIALEIVNSGLKTVTSVTVASATDLELIDSDGTTTLAFATYTTLGSLVDAINATDNWTARILDGLRSTTITASELIPDSLVTAVTVSGETVYQIFVDTSVAKSLFYRVSADRGVLNTDFGQVRDQVAKGGHRVKINGLTYYANVNAAANNGVRIYEFDAATLTETQIWGAKSVDATSTTHDFTLNPITASEGNDLIVRITDSSSLTDDASNALEVNYVRE